MRAGEACLWSSRLVVSWEESVALSAALWLMPGDDDLENTDNVVIIIFIIFIMSLLEYGNQRLERQKRLQIKTFDN